MGQQPSRIEMPGGNLQLRDKRKHLGMSRGEFKDWVHAEGAVPSSSIGESPQKRQVVAHHPATVEHANSPRSSQRLVTKLSPAVMLLSLHPGLDASTQPPPCRRSEGRMFEQANSLRHWVPELDGGREPSNGQSVSVPVHRQGRVDRHASASFAQIDATPTLTFACRWQTRPRSNDLKYPLDAACHLWPMSSPLLCAASLLDLQTNLGLTSATSRR